MPKYWIEVLLIGLMLLSGINLINQQHLKSASLEQQDHAIALQQAISELTVATLLSDYSNTQHLDNQAQLQLKAENIVEKLDDHAFLEKPLADFSSAISHYVQIATVLKTSKRFVASAEKIFSSTESQLSVKGEHLLALLLEYQTFPTTQNQSQINQYISANESVLAGLDEHGMQWNMLKRHIAFITINTPKLGEMIATIQSSPLGDVLASLTKQKSELVLTVNERVNQYLLVFISCIFLLLSTVLIRQSRALKISSRNANAAAEAKTQFLANMSHEIRTPLNGIIGLADLTLTTELTRPQKEYLDKLLFSARSLLTIINDILDFSKMESKKLDIEEIDFEVAELFSNMKTMIAKLAADKNIELIFEVSKNVPATLHGDPIRLGQILLNLASNAIKFTKEGHVLILVESINNNTHIRFSVKDTGIGLTQEQLDRLFQRFSQADSTTTRKYGGTGLGLAICKLLTELMRGNISVTSTPRKGTCFVVELPMPEGYPVEDKMVPQNCLSGKTLLLVEDHPITQKVTREMGEYLGIKVDVSDNLSIAQTLSENHHYDFALVDWQLPTQDGLVLLRKWKMAVRPPKHTLLFTAFDSHLLREQLEGLEDYPILNKPLLLSELHAALTTPNNALHTAKAKDLAMEEIDNVAKEPSSTEPESISKKPKVLLVEDNEINRIIAVEMLQAMRVDLETAENGKVAVEKVQNAQFDLVLMDIQMPEMDGMEATKILRQQYAVDEVPIIALTANVMKDEVTLYKRAGMNEHLGKPFDRKELEDVVQRYCFA